MNRFRKAFSNKYNSIIIAGFALICVAVIIVLIVGKKDL